MGPVTTNPWLIALINMTIVFGVLIALGMMMSVLQIIDPTKKKAQVYKQFTALSCSIDTKEFSRFSTCKWAGETKNKGREEWTIL